MRLYNYNGIADENDIAYIQRLIKKGLIKRDIEGVLPAPLSVHKGVIDNGKAKINPHVTRFLHKQNILDKLRAVQKYTDVVHVKPIYYLHQNGQWRPLSEVTTYYGNHRIDLVEEWDKHIDLRYLAWLLKRMELIGGNINIPSPYQRKDLGEVVPLKHGVRIDPRAAHILFTTTTFYPDPNPETTSVDGYVGESVDGESWATAHDKATSNDANDSGATAVDICDAAAGSGGYRIFRMIFLFDTSALGSGATISDVVLSIVYDSVGGSGHNDTSQYLRIVQSNPASNTAITTADFDAFTLHTDTATASLQVSSYPATGNYADFTFDATGRGWIAKTGVTKLGARRSPDADDSASHTLAPSGVTQSHRNWRTADQSGTSADPKLAVTYTTGTNYTKEIDEAITVVDTNINLTSKAVEEVITLAETIARSTGKLVTEAVALVETVATVFIANKVLSETITLVETTAAKVTAKILTDVITLQETVATRISALRITVTITLVDTLSTIRQYFKTITETVTLQETVARVFIFGRQIIETIALQDRLRGLKNGINMLLTNKYATKAGSYFKKYLDPK